MKDKRVVTNFGHHNVRIAKKNSVSIIKGYIFGIK